MNNADIITNNLPLFIPLIILEVGLDLAALIHIFRHKNYRMGNRILWVLLTLLVNPIGAILYFIIGREQY
ncbi:PLDc N-terminal domain-containing protein [Companilactobacillus jidongensis]|uniref:PLDc N-terminal domain-containing protein n=1 Tax=Companilactobacillus jidongensis TaxID=2486006 RepID=UPI000F790530|nr:PLD nuclease N-terminal domain-containing protein [Companilactobacillus jidongensis]